MKSLIFILQISCASALSVSANAAIVATLASSPPNSNLLDSFGGTGSVSIWQNLPTSPPARTDVGQQFHPVSLPPGASSYVVDRITVLSKGAGSGAAGAPFTLRIFDFGAGYTAVPNGSPITAQSGVVPAGLGYTYLSFDIDDVVLSAGTVYGFVLSFDAAVSNQFVSLIRASEFSATPPNQGNTLRSLTSSDGITFTGGTEDLTYYVQGTVPEPQFAIASVAALLLVMRWTPTGRAGTRR